MRGAAVILAVLTLAMAGCAFEGAGGLGTGTADQDDSSPDAGSGETGAPGDAGEDTPPCVTETLSASKTYTPSRWMNAQIEFEERYAFSIPAELSITSGNAANHCSFLFFGDNGDWITCAYKGGASVSSVEEDSEQAELGMTYHLVECRGGDTVGFLECGSLDLGILVDSDTAIANSIELEVNGDQSQGTTVVEVTVEGDCL